MFPPRSLSTQRSEKRYLSVSNQGSCTFAQANPIARSSATIAICTEQLGRERETHAVHEAVILLLIMKHRGRFTNCCQARYPI